MFRVYSTLQLEFFFIILQNQSIYKSQNDQPMKGTGTDVPHENSCIAREHART